MYESVGTLETAITLVKHGHPITICKGKSPLGEQWQERVWTPEAIEANFESNASLNVGIILGKRSGVIDIEGDDENSEADFAELFGDAEPLTWKYQSKRGIHRLFKYDPRLGANGKAVKKWKSLEIRGGEEKACHSLIPPSTTDGVTREWIIAPDQCELAELPEEVIRRLVPPPAPKATVNGGEGRPGDDFNHNGPTWAEILEPHGWNKAGTDGSDVMYWRRPGKDHGISATSGYLKTDDGAEVLYVFSTSAKPLEGETAYTKFAAWTFLNHGGDFKTAAAGLVEQGYGKSSSANAGPSVATCLIEMVAGDPGVELFHTPQGETFVTLPIDGHEETMRLNHSRCKEFLSRGYYRKKGTAASSKAISDAIGVLSGIARFDGEEKDIHLRIAGDQNAIYIDRGTADWDVIEVTPDNYRVITSAPVKFWRSTGMLALPMPEANGSIDELRSLVTIDDQQFKLLIGVLLSYFRPKGPYPITVITGEQGTAKSTTADLIRSFIDPKTVQRQGDPKNLEALMVAARNNWVISYDNLSSLHQWLSDGLCRLSTGGGFSARQLYSDAEEFAFDAKRPVIINSIADVATKPDLLDRALALELQPISADKRLSEDDFWADVRTKQPRILGALLAALSSALKNQSTVELVSKPRMADVAKWVTAAEPALGWESGDFLTAYQGNQLDASKLLLESVVVQAVTKLVDQVISWEGTPTALYRVLAADADDLTRHSGWPNSAGKLAAELRRVAPVLRQAGYDFKAGKSNGDRFVRIAKA